MKKSTKLLLRIVSGIALLGVLLVLLAMILGASWEDVQIGAARVIKPARIERAESEAQIESDECWEHELECGVGRVLTEE